MKRTLLGTLWIGAIAAGLAILLQLTGLLARPEAALSRTMRLSLYGQFGFGNYLLVIVLGFLFAWTLLAIERPLRQLALLLIVVSELLGAAWLLRAAGIFFMPLPAIAALVVVTVAALALGATTEGKRRRQLQRTFAGRMSDASLEQLAKNKAAFLEAPATAEASFVFCEIANEGELIDDLELKAFANARREFTEVARACLQENGGCLQTADGEGVRAFFGFPNPNPDHAAEAARAVLALRRDFARRAAEKPDSLGKFDLRIGLSSGMVVAAPRDDESVEVIASGEPLETARRLARANQIYGSRILLDPRASHRAGEAIVARPIDFLDGIAPHDRLEVYELLSLAEDANPVDLSRRDRFWMGVVHFRAKRWNEALAAFQSAQPNDGENDLPLQWYLRRLEPLCLQTAGTASPGATRLASL